MYLGCRTAHKAAKIFNLKDSVVSLYDLEHYLLNLRRKGANLGPVLDVGIDVVELDDRRFNAEVLAMWHDGRISRASDHGVARLPGPN